MNASARHLARLPRMLVLAAVTSLVVACGPAEGIAGPIATPGPTSQPSVVQSPDATVPPSPSPTASPGNSADPSVTARPGSAAPSGEATTIVRAYLLAAGASAGSFPYRLVPVLRAVPETKGVARAAMTQLLAAGTSSQLSTEIPAGTTLLGITVDGSGVATVDLSARFADGGTASSQIARVAQVVYTLTQFSNVTGVLVEIEGEPLAVPDGSGRTHTEPVRRADYREILPAIFVDRPAYEAAIGNPARVAGLANVFEATFRVRLLDAAHRTLVDRQAMATCGTGCWGTFDVTLPYSVATAQWGTLLVYDRSARDGSPENVVEYRVWLTPA